MTDTGYKTPCWLWDGRTLANGYAAMNVGSKGAKRTKVAHREYYEATYGKVKPRLTLDHLCDVRHCVNPDHLDPKTNAANCQRGKASKLDWEKVAFIRASELPTNDLARHFGVFQTTIDDVRAGRTWKAQS